MILKSRYYLFLLALFMIPITNSCGQKKNHSCKTIINSFIEKAQNEPVEIFEGWDIWARKDGIVFDFMVKNYRLLVVNKSKEMVLFKEIFPKQDSVFYPLIEMESRLDRYPFMVTNFTDKLLLFQKLNVNQVNSIMEDSLIMFINESFSVIYSQNGTDIRELNRFKEYSKYDNYWYYYLKE